MSTRPRPQSTLPKPPTTLHANSVIADSASLTGKHHITIGADTILHPRAKILSTHNSVVIGTGCIVSEKAVVGLQNAVPDSNSELEVKEKDRVQDKSEITEIRLGNDVVLEPGAVVEGSVGQGSIIEAGGKVGAGAVVGKYCKIAPLCIVPAGEILEDFSIVFGNNQRRKEKPGLENLRKITHDKEIEVLRKLIPSNLAKWQSVGESGVV